MRLASGRPDSRTHTHDLISQCVGVEVEASREDNTVGDNEKRRRGGGGGGCGDGDDKKREDSCPPNHTNDQKRLKRDDKILKTKVNRESLLEMKINFPNIF